MNPSTDISHTYIARKKTLWNSGKECKSKKKNRNYSIFDDYYFIPQIHLKILQYIINNFPFKKSLIVCDTFNAINIKLTLEIYKKLKNCQICMRIFNNVKLFLLFFVFFLY